MEYYSESNSNNKSENIYLAVCIFGEWNNSEQGYLAIKKYSLYFLYQTLLFQII